MADMSNNNGGGDSIDTSIDGIRKTVEGALASGEGDDDDDDDSDDTGGDAEEDSSGDDAAGDDSDDTDDDSEDADDSEDDDEDAESGDKKDPKSDRKYSQFKGDGSDKAYIGNLEEGYKNSSAEAIRLKGENEQISGRLDSLLRVVADNPGLSKALNEALQKSGGAGNSGSDDGKSGNDENLNVDNPFIRNMQAEWQEKSEAEIQEFIDANPEVSTDPQIKADVQHYMKLFSNDYHQRTGKLMSGGEAMAAAYKHLGLEDKRGKQDLADGAKKNLTPPRSRGNKAKKSGGQKPTFTADQIAMARAMGRDEAWLQKNAN